VVVCVHARLVAGAGMHGYVEPDDLGDRPGEMLVQVAEHVVVRGVDHDAGALYTAA
jgi:hypothetical protein